MTFWRYKDSVAGDRQLIAVDFPFSNKKLISEKGEKSQNSIFVHLFIYLLIFFKYVFLLAQIVFYKVIFTGIFKVELEIEKVQLLEDGVSVDIGETLVYQALE